MRPTFFARAGSGPDLTIRGGASSPSREIDGGLLAGAGFSVGRLSSKYSNDPNSPTVSSSNPLI